MTSSIEILSGMMRENTGRALCDSGGEPKYDANGNYVGSQYGYGRNYERNLSRSFEKEEIASVKFEIWNGTLQIEFALNTCLWLEERCYLATELDELFHGRFREECDADNSKYWLELMEEFPAWLAKQEDEEGNPLHEPFGGIYGDGEIFTTNTYNYECVLDQTIQFTYFSNDGGEYIALQIHGGADVRGGYTKPRIFSVGNHSELDIFDYQRGTIYCTGEDHHPTALALKEKQEKQLALPLKGAQPSKIDFEGSYNHHWDTDDGCHWYYDGSCGLGAERQLEKYETRDLDDEDSEEGDVWEEGILCIKDGIGYCPYCGARLDGASL